MTESLLKGNILLTAFRNTSAELLIRNAKKHRTLFLPNDNIKDSEMLISAISQEKFDYVISFGQRPNIKDKIHIETTAQDIDFCIDTNLDCEELRLLFVKNGIYAKISHNAGSSFCNRLYLSGLRYISDNRIGTKMVFIHIPFEKNITDFDSFRTKMLNTVANMNIHMPF